MKTHQEIRDAIDETATLSPDDAETQLRGILHALNDRIARLEDATRTCLEHLEKRLEEIHPTIT